MAKKPSRRRQNTSQLIFSIIGILVILAMVLAMVAPW